MAGPKFLGADVLGDTMMLRFSLLHADWGSDFCAIRIISKTVKDILLQTTSLPGLGSSSSWGMCRSGKTANELLLEKWFERSGPEKLGDVVIMIGTYDILRIVQDISLKLPKQTRLLKHTINKIREKASRKYNRIIFCTVPEIPLLADEEDVVISSRYTSLLKSVNDYIVELGVWNENVRSVNMEGKFSRDCYDNVKRSVFNPFLVRLDNIHLNCKGLAILQEILLEELRVPS